MIQLLNNLIELGIEYLKLKNQSFIFDKIDFYEKEKYEKIGRLEELRNSGVNSNECVFLRKRISELNGRIEHLSAINLKDKKGNENTNN